MGILNKIGRGAAAIGKGIGAEMNPAYGKKIVKELTEDASKATDKVFFDKTRQIAKAPMFSGITDSSKLYNITKNSDHKLSALQSIKLGHSKGVKVTDGKLVSEGLAYGKIAGTVATVGIGGRVVTGGGLYRDRYGNVNLPGMPFI